MKKIVFAMLLAFVVSAVAYSQEVPQVQLKNLKGKVVNSQEIIENDGKPVMVCFLVQTLYQGVDCFQRGLRGLG